MKILLEMSYRIESILLENKSFFNVDRVLTLIINEMMKTGFIIVHTVDDKRMSGFLTRLNDFSRSNSHQEYYCDSNRVED